MNILNKHTKVIKRNIFKIKTVKELKELIRIQHRKHLLYKINHVKSDIELNLGRYNKYQKFIYRNYDEHIAIRFICFKNKHLKLTENKSKLDPSRIHILIEERK